MLSVSASQLSFPAQLRLSTSSAMSSLPFAAAPLLATDALDKTAGPF
jgi:hypothetical protein